MPLARDLTPEALHREALAAGARGFQASALVRAVWQRGIRDFSEATELPQGVRERLRERITLAAASVASTSESADGTRKFLLSLTDGESIEIVVIPEGKRVTLCMSTQVGCPVRCVFCASGMYGVRRNLRAAELVEQFVLARALAPNPLTNIVVMGIGEPMLNVDALDRALAAICSPDGFGFSARRVTISTSGYPDRIRWLARRGRPHNLAVSLHAADDPLRKRLVPTATATTADLVAAAADWFACTGRKPTFEVVLLEGINDRSSDAERIADLLRGHRATVNLIPWNEVPELAGELRRPSPRRVARFREILVRSGLEVTWRKRRGHDRNAACGQLRLTQLVRR